MKNLAKEVERKRGASSKEIGHLLIFARKAI